MKKSVYGLASCVAAALLVGCSQSATTPTSDIPTAIECSGVCGEQEFKLAQQYHQGEQQQQDLDKALANYILAAKAGNVAAMTQVAVLYKEGLTSEGTKPELAIDWLNAAAQQQDAQAQFLLAESYWNGEGVAQDFTQAEYWYNQAALNKDKEAAYLLGLRYFEGEHMAEDPVTGYVWMSIAALLGHPNAPGDRDFLIGEELDMKQKKAAWQEVDRLIKQLDIEVPW
jgi:TPR repeat protein